MTDMADAGNDDTYLFDVCILIITLATINATPYGLMISCRVYNYRYHMLQRRYSISQYDAFYASQATSTTPKFLIDIIYAYIYGLFAIFISDIS